MPANQYYVVFGAVLKKKAGLQRVKIDTELSNTRTLTNLLTECEV